MKPNLKLLLAAGVFLPLHLIGAAAQAQEVGEIVVTARNRSERLQEVPLAITALTGEQLIQSGARELKDVASMTPGLIINGSGSEAYNTPTMRGLVSLGGTSDPTVATFYDGAYLLSSSANNIAMLDLDRIEIVKGPVNSLYGRPAYAGAINYISRTPTDTPEFRGTATLGNDGQRKILAVGGFAPVPGVLKIRAAAAYDHYSGGYEDAVTGLRAGGYTKKDAQVSFAFTPTEKFSAQGRLYYGDDTFGMAPIGYADNNCGPLNANGLFPLTARTFYCGLYDEDQHAVEVSPDAASDHTHGNQREIWNGFLRLNYDAGIADITALTTYTHLVQQRFEDFYGRRVGIPYFLVSAANPPPTAPPPSTAKMNLITNFGSDQQDEDFAQELRITSKPDTRLRWNVGGYYADVTDYTSTITAVPLKDIPAGFTYSGNATSCAIFQCDRVFASSDGRVSNAVSAAETESRLWSGFAGAEFDIVKALTVTLDGRYSSDRRTVDNISLNSSIGVYRPLGPPRTITFNNWTYRGSIKYQFNPDQMVYATIANGVKAGGFNQRAVHVEELPYGVEKNTTYELGFKSQFLDRRLQLNGSAFYIELTGLQLSGPSSFADTIGLVTKNIGGATSKGAELEGEFRATQWLTLRAGGSYVDSTIDDGTYDFSFAGQCQAVGAQFCEQSRIQTVTTPAGPRTAYHLGGLPVRGQSEYTFSGAIDVNTPLNDGWSLFGMLRYRYQSRQYANVQDVTWWDPLNRFDLRVGVEKGPIRVTAFMDNVTDNDTPDSVFQSTFLNDFSLAYYAAMPTPRRFGLTVDYKFQ